MKLLYSDIYYPKPIFMNSQGDLYEIPFQLCLLHSVEEIEEKSDSMLTISIYRCLQNTKYRFVNNCEYHTNTIHDISFIHHILQVDHRYDHIAALCFCDCMEEVEKMVRFSLCLIHYESGITDLVQKSQHCVPTK